MSHESVLLNVKTQSHLENASDLTQETRINEETLENVKNQAFAEGYQEAEKKLAETYQCKLQALANQKALLDQLLKNLPNALQDYHASVRDQIAEIVLLIVRQYFTNQASSKEAIIFQVEQAINHLNHKENIELFLHPQDLNLVQQSKLNIDFSECRHLKLIPDETLALGGCRLRNDHGLIDASIELQIDKLKQMLLQLKKSMPQ